MSEHSPQREQNSGSTHLSAQEIKGYGERTLQPTQLLAVDDHLAVCQLCRERLKNSQSTTRSLSERSRQRLAATKILWSELQVEIEADTRKDDD